MFDFTPYDLRKRPTVAEQILWSYLRSRQMLGLKFRRQHPIGPFITDFVCLKRKIIIEVDGSIHQGRESYDQRRDSWLKSQGYSILRIKNEELMQNQKDALMKIRGYLMRWMGF